MRIVILGAPGAGKRTQSALLAEKLALAIVTTGDLLKQAIAEESELGLEVKALQDAGRIVTEDIILGLIREQLLLPAMADGFILDGFPRNLLQALTLDELLQEISQPLDLVLLIDIDNDHLMERLVGRRTCRSCGQLYNIYRNPPIVDGVCDTCGGRLHQRSDDNEETVSSRIHVFDHLIAPLITHYEKSDRLVRVDGNGSLETVFGHLMQAIEDAGSDTGVISARANKAVAGSGKRSDSKAVTQAETKSGGDSSAVAQGKDEKRASEALKSAKRPSKQPSKKSAAKAAKASKKPPQKPTKPSKTKKAEASKPKRKSKQSAKPAVKRAKVSSEKPAQVKKKKKLSSKAKPKAKVVKKSPSKRSKPVVSRKKTTQTKKKVTTKSRTTAKVVKKSVAKKGKPTTPSKKKVSAKTRTSVNTVKKAKSKVTRKKALPSKKKVVKKPLQAAKTRSRKKLVKKKPAAKKTVKKRVTKTARKSLSKKSTAAKKKSSLKKSRGSQVKKVTAKRAKKQTGKKSLAKKALTRKKASASKKALKKKLKK
ncbi:MAG: nucleoside monophosphate kinase [Candidatus Thiodiazotropha taylori]|nr:nucleoside monophosphate kinase [Candidatus Thiodiazotropha taylori]